MNGEEVVEHESDLEELDEIVSHNYFKISQLSDEDDLLQDDNDIQYLYNKKNIIYTENKTHADNKIYQSKIMMKNTNK